MVGSAGGIGNILTGAYDDLMSTQISNVSAAVSQIRGRPWPKGTSGNPGGRPKVAADVRALARQLTAQALNALAEIMEDSGTPAAARISAAKELLDRGWGKAPAALIMAPFDLPQESEPVDQLQLEMEAEIEAAKRYASEAMPGLALLRRDDASI